MIEPRRLTLLLASVILLAGCDERFEGDKQPAFADQHAMPVAMIDPPVSHAAVATAAFDRDFIGIDRPEATARFGSPVSAHPSAPGEALMYRDRQCAMTLTFYPEIDSRVYRALAYEVTSDDDTRTGRHDCLQRFASLLHGR